MSKIKMEQTRKGKLEKLKKDITTQKYFDVLAKGPTHKFIDNILKEIKRINSKNILDVGCGTGYVTKRISKINPDIIGCDTDKKRLELARIYTKNRIKFVPLYIERKPLLPFPNDSFDLVISLEVLEHIQKYKETIQELKRVSKKYVIITVPNEPLFRIANFLRGKYLKDFGNAPGHINHFNKKSIVKILRKYFKIKKAQINALFWITVVCEK